MKILIPALAAALLLTTLSLPASAACPEFSNWSTSWTDSFGQTKYKLTAPCKVYLGIPFTVVASATDSYYPNSNVGWNWKITDNGDILAENSSIIGGIQLTDGYWMTSLEQTYWGTPIDHALSFTFTDFGKGSGGMGWGGSTLGGLTVDPYLITLASSFGFSVDQQNSTTIPATVFVPVGSTPLTYRWLEGADVIQASQPVNGTGTVNVPLNLAAVPTLATGSHTFTLEVTDGTLVGSKTTTVSVGAAPSVAGSCGSSSSQSLSVAPTENLCLTGTPSAVTGSGPWNWTCGGSNGGGSASCSASAVNGGSAPIGTNVKVTPAPGVSMSFSTVSAGGSVTATPTTSLSPPANFRAINGGSYLITTTASFSGSISIGLSYSDSALSSPGNESRIRLFHYNGQAWEDVTTSVDTVNNIVYGSVSSLSPFMLAEPITGVPATPVGGWGMSLVTMLSIMGYGYWKSRK